MRAGFGTRERRLTRKVIFLAFSKPVEAARARRGGAEVTGAFAALNIDLVQEEVL